MHTQNLGILIGRFQPLHLGHVHLIEAALKQCEHLLIVIGSANRARNLKNPFSFNERKNLITETFPNVKLHFAAIPDFFYSETAWLEAVKSAVAEISPLKTTPTLFGYSKDETTYYLNEFPAWHYVELPNFKGINATEIRQNYFLNSHISHTDIPQTTQVFLENFQTTSEYARISEEAHFVKSYKASWAQSPYPPLFVTTDALVTCQEHILLIKRKFCPGKGLYALPGGFLEENEWIKTGLIRELVEETKIGMSEADLEKHLKSIRVFDYPDRSLIGRVITHCGHFDLPGPLPTIEAADDALETTWIPRSTLFKLRDQFHDDHYQIITTVLNCSGL